MISLDTKFAHTVTFHYDVRRYGEKKREEVMRKCIEWLFGKRYEESPFNQIYAIAVAIWGIGAVILLGGSIWMISTLQTRGLWLFLIYSVSGWILYPLLVKSVLKAIVKMNQEQEKKPIK